MNLVTGMWVFMGDFNEVRSIDERMNCNINQVASDNFNEFIEEANLNEYHMGGFRYTFVSKNMEKASKIDRVPVCDSFFNQWPNATLMTLDPEIADHRPLVLKTSSFDNGPTPFRFFNSWLKMEGLEGVVSDAIGKARTSEPPDVILADKFKQIKAATKLWNQNHK
jgi:hypothetical protein